MVKIPFYLFKFKVFQIPTKILSFFLKKKKKKKARPMFLYPIMSWTDHHNPNRMSLFFNSRCQAGRVGNNPISSCLVLLFLVRFWRLNISVPLFYTEIGRPVLWIEEESVVCFSETSSDFEAPFLRVVIRRHPKPPRLLSRLTRTVEFRESGVENISDENITVILLNAFPESFNDTGNNPISFYVLRGDLAVSLLNESSSFLFLYYCPFSANSFVAVAVSRHSWLTACLGGL
ncbi:hypothetical protein M9H77_34972 [Catharanthus roseus]|uniref:Uncharacterized protein n=1 Tax=Catharanthus roseus TaxID=4058 RepID=A0ACB9ZMP4_CATRO|nr:hypothetical protein M9H77_34972 [Catharanthus roseus]